MKLNTAKLKTIALIAMVIDHIAHFLLPINTTAYILMRIIGRIAAPIFWFCFTEGLFYTSNEAKYIQRLGISAGAMGIGNIVISKLLNTSVVNFLSPNIFLSLFLAAFVIRLIKYIIEKKSLMERCSYISLTLILSFIITFYAEYGLLALSCILCFYFMRDCKLKYIVVMLTVVLYCAIQHDILQSFMLLSIPFLLLYTSEKPKKSWKTFFYMFYPIHIWLLIFISMLI